MDLSSPDPEQERGPAPRAAPPNAASAPASPPDALHAWITCFCAVNFDIEYGQKLELTFPSGMITAEEEHAITFNAFPDSMSSAIGDTSFCFRFRECGAASAATAPSPPPPPPPLAVTGNAQTKAVPRFSYGYVFFRQQQNASLARGYEQRSLVLISHQPFVGLFLRVARTVGALYFEYGRSALEAVCQNISRWPEPRPGAALELPLAGDVVTTVIPGGSSLLGARVAARESLHAAPRKSRVGSSLLRRVSESALLRSPRPSTGSPTAPAASSSAVAAHARRDPGVRKRGVFQELNLYITFRSVIADLWRLWELMLTGETVLVLSATPAQCSEAVLGLVSLIHPVVYRGDFRPYFTIHDADFRVLTSRDRDRRAALLGVTNPFFLKVEREWEHTLVVGASPGSRRARAAGSERADGLVSAAAPALDADTSVMRKLIRDTFSEVEGQANSDILRMHFREITDTFLQAYEPYLSVKRPDRLHPFENVPPLLEFRESEFLERVFVEGPPEYFAGMSKNAFVDLHRRFVRSCNFGPWLRSRQEQLLEKARRVYRDAAVRADMPAILGQPDNTEVQLVDLYLQIKERLLVEESGDMPDFEFCTKMRAHLSAVIARLPPDLRDSLAARDDFPVIAQVSGDLAEMSVSSQELLRPPPLRLDSVGSAEEALE